MKLDHLCELYGPHWSRRQVIGECQFCGGINGSRNDKRSTHLDQLNMRRYVVSSWRITRHENFSDLEEALAETRDSRFNDRRESKLRLASG